MIELNKICRIKRINFIKDWYNYQFFTFLLTLIKKRILTLLYSDRFWVEFTRCNQQSCKFSHLVHLLDANNFSLLLLSVCLTYQMQKIDLSMIVDCTMFWPLPCLFCTKSGVIQTHLFHYSHPYILFVCFLVFLSPNLAYIIL